MQDVPKIVRERLAQAGFAVAESHPDADLLTAFAEQSLAAKEHENVVKHLAHCGDCREIVALALPEVEVSAEAVENRTGTTWLRWPALRWAAVAAGVLVVTTVGVWQLRQHDGRTQVATNLMATEKVAEQTAAPSSITLVTPPSSSGLPATRGKQVEAKKKVTAAGEARSLQADKLVAANPVLSRSDPASAGIGQSAANVAAAKASPPVPSASEAVEVAGAAPLAQTEPAAQSATRELAGNQAADAMQSLGKQAEAVVRAKPTLAQNSAARAGAELQKDSMLQRNQVQRWNISPDGALRRSLDGGRTWLEVNLAADISSSNLAGQIQPEATGRLAKTPSVKRADAKAAPVPPAAAVFRALSVSSNASEMWAGGVAGVLYHTMDGGDLWVRVVPSDGGVALTGDILGIEFSDSRNGTLTTNTETWTTQDSGQSWHKQQ